MYIIYPYSTGWLLWLCMGQSYCCIDDCPSDRKVILEDMSKSDLCQPPQSTTYRVASGQGKVREKYFLRSEKIQGILWKVRENLWMWESRKVKEKSVNFVMNTRDTFYCSRHLFVQFQCLIRTQVEKSLQWRRNERDDVSNSIVCSAVQPQIKKHQSYASLAFVRGIHQCSVDSPDKGPVTQKMFPFDGVIMCHWVETRLMYGLSTPYSFFFVLIHFQTQNKISFQTQHIAWKPQHRTELTIIGQFQENFIRTTEGTMMTSWYGNSALLAPYWHKGPIMERFDDFFVVSLRQLLKVVHGSM